jgi:ribosomal protein S18 acetylase RimI-like enzyme
MNNIKFKNLDLSLVKPLVSFQKKFEDELNGNIFIEQEIIRNLNSKYFYSNLCVANNLVSGFIIAQRVLNVFEIYSLFVAPDSRRVGIAMTLLNDLIKMCKKQRIEKILLEVMEMNKAAINLYLKNNFEIYSERKNYYKQENKKISAKLMRLSFK